MVKQKEGKYEREERHIEDLGRSNICALEEKKQ